MPYFMCLLAATSRDSDKVCILCADILYIVRVWDTTIHEYSPYRCSFPPFFIFRFVPTLLLAPLIPPRLLTVVLSPRCHSWRCFGEGRNGTVNDEEAGILEQTGRATRPKSHCQETSWGYGRRILESSLNPPVNPPSNPP